MFYNQLFALGLTSVHFLAKEGNVLLRNEFFKFQQKIVAFPLCSVYLSYYFSDFHSSVVFVPIVIGVLRSKEKKNKSNYTSICEPVSNMYVDLLKNKNITIYNYY